MVDESILKFMGQKAGPDPLTFGMSDGWGCVLGDK
jgi:hypothetical protein